MSAALAEVILNGVIILLLGAMIYYSVHLSKVLTAFRDGRAELGKLIDDLNRSIVRAEGAIEGLRRASDESGDGLQAHISKAKGLSEELQLIVEAGNSLAERLEKRAGEARKIQETGEYIPGVPSSVPDRPVKPRQKIPQTPVFEEETEPFPDSPFAIRDPDFDRGDMGEDTGLFDDGSDAVPEQSAGMSRAERELMDALRKKAKR